MMSSLVRRGSLAVLFAASLSACGSCGSKTQTTGCGSDQDCIDQHGGDSRWYCDTKVDPHLCTEAARDCDTSADCCPSQICNLQGHFCVDKVTQCSGPGSCTVAGQICASIGVRPPAQGCTFNKCSSTGTCADASTVCFNGYCVGQPPCNGGCPDLSGQHQVCVTATSLCSPAPKDSSGSCAVSCATGQMLVLHDPDNIFDTCSLSNESCDCVALPPLVVRDVSRHSGLALSGANLYVSAYDGAYGDLVVHTFDKSNLSKPTKSEWLDGVPATGTLGGDPKGPRHGITNPGPNVGQYTSIAAAPNGDLFVAYYDVDNGDLKFVARYGGPAAPWTTPVTLDGSTSAGAMSGDTGLYTSIALTAEGIPAIAYFRRGSYDGTANAETGLNTALTYIIAGKSQPLARTDWSAPADVEQADRPAPPCSGACSASQVCVSDANAVNGQRCATPAPTCAPACSGSQTCVNDLSVPAQPICLTSLQAASLPDLPPGTGLMPSLKFLDDKPVIAYYDSVHRQLKAVMAGNPASGSTLSTPGFGAPVVIDSSLPDQPARDVGRWPSLAIGPSNAAGGRIAITYQDATRQQLLLYASNTLTANASASIHVLDNGLPAAGDTWHPQSFPGVQSSVSFTPAGKLAIAYQDGTPVNLLFSTWDPGSSSVSGKTTVRGSDSAAGFYPHVVVDSNGTAYISSATIRAATAELAANFLWVDSQTAP
jgi:hypothetical protein